MSDPSTTSAGATRGRRALRWVAALVWGAGLVAYGLAVVAQERSPLDVLIAVVAFLRDHPLGPLAYVAVYAARPLALFSAALLSVGGGVLYGPVAGVALVAIGANLSALVAYGLGRVVGADVAGPALRHPRLRGTARRLREHAFETVLTLRFVFAPYDAVNALAGALRLPVLAFVLATAVGSLPGTLVFVLFGASLGDVAALEAGLPRPDPALLAASAALFLASLALARWWRAREARRRGAEPTAPDRMEPS